MATGILAVALAAMALTARVQPPADQPAETATAAAPAAPVPALHGEALAMDEARGRLVLVGGRGADDWLRGTWEWDGTRWRQAVDAGQGPGARAGHALAFDPATRQTILFGGMVSPPVTLLCDTWTYDGAAWTRRDRGRDACPTDRVRNTSLVYDVRRRQMLLLDGPAIGGEALRPLRVWRWAGDAWALVDDKGPRRAGFSQAAFDAKRGVLVVPVLFGGPDAGVWEWDGQTWAHHRASGPVNRQAYAFVWDSSRERLVLKGGQGGTRGPYLSDTWVWNGMRWVEGGATAQNPPGRGGATLVDDARRRRLLYFGGYAEGMLSDFWAFDSTGWQPLSR